MTTWSLYYWSPWQQRFKLRQTGLTDWQKRKLLRSYQTNQINPELYYFVADEEEDDV